MVGEFAEKNRYVVIRILAGVATRAGTEQHYPLDPLAEQIVESAAEALQDGIVDNRSHRDFPHRTENTFITSSPRWLMTLTAMRPDVGLEKGREVSLLRLAQASSSISALNVVFSAL